MAGLSLGWQILIESHCFIWWPLVSGLTCNTWNRWTPQVKWQTVLSWQSLGHWQITDTRYCYSFSWKYFLHYSDWSVTLDIIESFAIRRFVTRLSLVIYVTIDRKQISPSMIIICMLSEMSPLTTVTIAFINYRSNQLIFSLFPSVNEFWYCNDNVV